MLAKSVHGVRMVLTLCQNGLPLLHDALVIRSFDLAEALLKHGANLMVEYVYKKVQIAAIVERRHPLLLLLAPLLHPVLRLERLLPSPKKYGTLLAHMNRPKLREQYLLLQRCTVLLSTQ